MNQSREYHSQCTLGEFLYVFFGRNQNNPNLNTIEKINADNIINGLHTRWSNITLSSDMKPRAFTLASQIDDTSIAILGGSNGKIIGEVIIFYPEENWDWKTENSNSNKFLSSHNNCIMSEKGYVIGIDRENNRLIEY